MQKKTKGDYLFTEFFTDYNYHGGSMKRKVTVRLSIDYIAGTYQIKNENNQLNFKFGGHPRGSELQGIVLKLIAEAITFALKEIKEEAKK